MVQLSQLCPTPLTRNNTTTHALALPSWLQWDQLFASPGRSGPTDTVEFVTREGMLLRPSEVRATQPQPSSPKRLDVALELESRSQRARRRPRARVTPRQTQEQHLAVSRPLYQRYASRLLGSRARRGHGARRPRGSPSPLRAHILWTTRRCPGVAQPRVVPSDLVLLETVRRYSNVAPAWENSARGSEEERPSTATLVPTELSQVVPTGRLLDGPSCVRLV